MNAQSQEQSAQRFTGATIKVGVLLGAIFATLLHGVLLFSIQRFGPEIGAFRFDPHSPATVAGTFFFVFFYTILFSAFQEGHKGPAKIVFYLYYILLVLPLLSSYTAGFQFASAEFVLLCFGSFTVAWVSYRLFPNIKIPSIDVRFLQLAIALAVVTSLFTYAYLIVAGGLGRLNFDFTRVYEVRAEASDDYVGLVGYLIPWQGNVLNMFFLVYTLRRRAWAFVLLVYAAQVFLFGMTNHKSFLFAPLLVTGMYFFRDFRFLFLKIAASAVAMTVAAAAFYLIAGNVMVPSLFIRRLFLVPAVNHFLYFDFFSQPQNPFLYLSGSVLSGINTYPYEIRITQVISATYSDGRGSWNVGYLGDAYSNFGVVGMFAFSILLGIVCKLTDSAARNLPLNLSAAIFAVPAIAMVNSAFFTCMLTHGFLVSVLFVWILSSSDRESERGLFFGRNDLASPAGGPRAALSEQH